MAEETEIKIQLRDITECPICTEIYTDPKVLPCIHTFCLNCITSWGKDMQPGDKVSCPMCRKEFTVPAGGFNNLPKDFFIAKLLDVKMNSSVKSEAKPVPSCCEMCCVVKIQKKLQPYTA